MQIKLIADTPNTRGLPSIQAKNGETRLIQTDYDFPGIANTFGWSIQSVQWPIEDSGPCEHSGTDGTIPCPKCGMPASKFISSARQWIDDNDGAQVDDPGYFADTGN